jgi:hypothetical protein
MTFASLLIHYSATTLGKPYCLSHPSSVINNTSQEEKTRMGVMRLEGWPGFVAPLFDNKELDVVALMVAR